MIEAVLDTNIIIAALRSRRGKSFQLLSLVGGDDRFGVNLSVPLVLEYEEVLLRNLSVLKLSATDVNDLLDYLCSVASLHRISFLWRPQLKDADDDMLLELAVEANCQYIVTHNKRDFVGSETFGVQAITPGGFLQLIGE